MSPGLVGLLRHGETSLHGRFNGQSSSRLTPRGWAQMRAAVAGCRFQRILSSPLPRCAEFARELAARADLPLEWEDRFMEMGFGDWEGMTNDQIMAVAPERLQAFRAQPETVAAPGGETLTEVRERVQVAWEAWQAVLSDEQVLVITHAGVIRLLVMHALEADPCSFWHIPVPYASLSYLQLDRGNTGRPLQLLSLNGMGAC